MSTAPSHPREARPQVESFFDTDTNTVSYVVIDPQTNHCAIIDSVLDYDPHSGRTSHQGAQRLVDFVQARSLTVEWLLETHVHADHLSAAPWIQARVGGKLAIGDQIRTVQETFGTVFNAGPDFPRDGSQFDHLFRDGEQYQLGELTCRALHTPGHTPACMSHLIGDAVFVGDTLFMPDYGTARCDFPGGDARTLYRSIQKLLALPDDTRMFLCHDYLPDNRQEFHWQTTVGEQRRDNIHVHQGVGEAEFVAMREKRDATLGMPRLILPSVQVNMRAGHLPPAENNGTQYLKIPLNVL
ncbi:MBL fold metallo-hydrolase [Alloalcanivorax gelatiniphagus]|uniref:MBL fold metallo-hydrolase n=1 Tax=Alloalcanivorax gelatiniphagus TaxID=1194167 RepID=A0ABY2XJQ6_9GAMM|nr:MBL fold metallo-hydrolase [Alloalcanivorax gelatiniphagus]TMW12186.1 MBL fold metallo-hydrolase [Alloalcanivorax gelatiniphagus]